MTREKKIVLIGPVFPYRGGIAHYTALLYKTLANSATVHIISFKRQYPKWMVKKKQKDYSDDSLRIDEAEFLLDTANPFNILQTAKYINELNPDILILQWWHPYFAPCYRILTCMCKKCKILFICHNVLPHERFPFDYILTKSVLKKGNYFVVHAVEESVELENMIPDANYKINPHPTYDFFKIENMTKEVARERIRIQQDVPLLLFFGFVREYKGLKHLLKAMPKVISMLPNVKLLIVGEFGNDKEEYNKLISDLQIKDSLIIVDQYVADCEVEQYFAASDIVVLPYESATQSGIAQIAYGFEKPVIATNVGGLPDVVQDSVTGYLVEPFNSTAIADAIIRFFLSSESDNFIEGIKENAYRFSWDCMADTILSFGEK